MAVSVVLHGAGNKKVTVSPEKAERIREAAKKLRYRPNHVARSLKSQRTHQVAVVFQHFFGMGPQNPYHIQLLGGVTLALFKHGYAMTLCPKMIVDEDFGSLSDGRFDGVLWCRPDFNEVSLEAIQTSPIPVVMLHVPPGSVLGVPTFCADNDGAMRRVVDHLRSLGHERMAFVIDPVSIKSVEGAARSKAFVQAATRAGLPEPDVLVLTRDHSMLERYAGPDGPHTALVCFSDELAGFLLRSCQKYGVDVPGHVSVVGFDSSDFCETTRPSLTSVNQPVGQMAQAAAEHLISLIENGPENPPAQMACILYDCGLDVRESTGPAPR
jgi:LacI family transcriptional regulator